MKKKIIPFVISVVFLIPFAVLAVDCKTDFKNPACAQLSDSATKGGGQTLDNPLKGVTSIPALINKVITAALGVVGSLALAMFVYGGFMWMASGGNRANKVFSGVV